MASTPKEAHLELGLPPESKATAGRCDVTALSSRGRDRFLELLDDVEAGPNAALVQAAERYKKGLGRFLISSLDPEAARSILDLRLAPEVLARVTILAERANEGDLTGQERDEYLSYVEAADALAVLELEARRSGADQEFA